MNWATQHPVLSAALGYCALAFVGTMPPKGTKWDRDVLYDWAYDFFHVLVNQIGQRGQKRNLPLDEKPAE